MGEVESVDIPIAIGKQLSVEYLTRAIADGKIDIVGGGRWFKHVEGLTYLPNIIDASYVFTRSAAGDLISGGRPEVILVAGDGAAPLVMYEWQKGVWKSKILIESLRDGHSITLADFDNNGNLDIFTAECRLVNATPKEAPEVNLHFAD